jgi:hypothetical protein
MTATNAATPPGRGDFFVATGGVVASLLNPRPIAFTPPGYESDWPRAEEWSLTAARFTKSSYCRGLSDASGAVLDVGGTSTLARLPRPQSGRTGRGTAQTARSLQCRGLSDALGAMLVVGGTRLWRASIPSAGGRTGRETTQTARSIQCRGLSGAPGTLFEGGNPAGFITVSEDVDFC